MYVTLSLHLFAYMLGLILEWVSALWAMNFINNIYASSKEIII